MEESNFQREENSQRRKEALEGKWGNVEEQLWSGDFIRIGFFFSFFEGNKVSFTNIFWICPF